MEQVDSPLSRRCGAREATSARVLCECEALEVARRTYLGFFFSDHEDIWSLSLGAISSDLDISLRGAKGLLKGQRVSGLKGLESTYSYILFYCNAWVW